MLSQLSQSTTSKTIGDMQLNTSGVDSLGITMRNVDEVVKIVKKKNENVNEHLLSRWEVCVCGRCHPHIFARFLKENIQHEIHSYKYRIAKATAIASRCFE